MYCLQAYICALFSQEILQAGAVKGLKHKAQWQLVRKQLDFHVPSTAHSYLKTQKV